MKFLSIMITGSILTCGFAWTMPTCHDLNEIIARANTLAASFCRDPKSTGNIMDRGVWRIVQTNLSGVCVLTDGRRWSVEEMVGTVKKSYCYSNSILSMYHEVDESSKRCRVYFFHPNGKLRQEIYTEDGRFVGCVREYSEYGILANEKKLHGQRVPILASPLKGRSSKSVNPVPKKKEEISTSPEVNHLALAGRVVERSRQLFQETMAVKGNSRHPVWKDACGWICFTNTAGNVVSDSGVCSKKGTQTITEGSGDIILSYTYRQGCLLNYVGSSEFLVEERHS